MCKEREFTLNMSLNNVLQDMKEAIETAFEAGDMVATVHYATRINALEEIVDSYVSMYKDDPDLME